MDFYKYAPAERIDILQNRLIRFTQPRALNDPFEGQPDFYALGTKEGFAKRFAEEIKRFPSFIWEEHRRAIRTDLDQFTFANKVKNDPDYAELLYEGLYKRNPQDLLFNLRERFYELHNNVGCLSLSETSDNLLMWAHYAAGHTGFALVLDSSHDFFKGTDSLPGFAKPERVEYRSERPRITIEDTSEKAGLREIFFIKGSDWEYEKEWRYLKYLTDAHSKIGVTNGHDVHLFRLPPKCIKGIILGDESSENLKDKIFAIKRDEAELKHLRIQQARTSQTDYGLEIKEIET